MPHSEDGREVADAEGGDIVSMMCALE